MIAALLLTTVLGLPLAGEAHAGAALDYAGWGDQRRFVLTELGLFGEGQRGRLTFAAAASASLDVFRQGEGGRWPPAFRLAARAGFAGARWRLRLGPSVSGHDRGALGFRAALVPLGNGDWRWDPAGCRFFYAAELGGHATQAAVGQGLHVGVGWPIAMGRARQIFTAVVLGELLGVAGRVTLVDDWIVGAQVGVDLWQGTGAFGHGALGFGASVGRGFGSSAPATVLVPPIPTPMTATLTAALAQLWQRSLALEHERAFTPILAAYAAVAGHDRLADAGVHLRGASLTLGLRFYPRATAPLGPYLGLDALSLGWLRASGWQSLDRPLGPRVDQTGSLVATGASAGWAFGFGGAVIALGLGGELRLRHFDAHTGAHRNDLALAPVARVNLGLGF